MTLLALPNTFTAGTTILSAQVNSNFTTIYNDYSGGITNANISASAAITDTKLAQITTASKVNVSALVATSQAQGDVFYASSASVISRLGAGTSGQIFKTLGAAANPIWDTYSNIFLTPKEYTDATPSTSTSDESNATSSYTDTTETITGTVGKQGIGFASFTAYASSASGVVFVGLNVDGTIVHEAAIGSGLTTPICLTWHGMLTAGSHTIKAQIKGNGSACVLKGTVVTTRLRFSYPT